MSPPTADSGHPPRLAGMLRRDNHGTGLPDRGTGPLHTVACMTEHSTFSRMKASTGVLASAALAVMLVGTPIAVLADPFDDTTAPESTFNVPTPPATGWYQGASVPVRVTATDSGTGVASISYVLGDGEPVTVPGGDVSLTIFTEGVNALTVWATDTAGNVEPTKTQFFRLDRTPPAIEVTTPTLVEHGAPLTLEYTCSDGWSGVVECASAPANGAALPTDELGEHTVAITASDVSGWTAAYDFRYLVAPDLTAPEVSLAIAPEPASGWYTTPIGVGVVASDATGIASRHWWTDGAVSTNGDVTGEEAEAVFTLDVEGVTDVSYWAYDRHGNRSDGTRRIRIDTVAPTVTVGGALPALAAVEHRQGERVVIRAICDDATSGVAGCGIVEVPSGVVPTDTLGDRRLTLFGTDAAGNRAEIVYAYRVVAADPVVPGGGAGGGGDADDPEPADPTLPASGDRPAALAATGVDLAGAVLVGGLLAGAGLGTIGARRMLRR